MFSRPTITEIAILPAVLDSYGYSIVATYPTSGGYSIVGRYTK
jgi:hypothetical protein